MRKFLLCFLLIAAMLLCMGCAEEETQRPNKKPGQSSSNSGEKNDPQKDPALEELISTIGTQGVTVEFGKIEAGRYGDTASITAQIPNYTQLFAAACKTDNPTTALARAIAKQEYTTIEYTDTVVVTYDGETPIYLSEDVVKEFIEQELIKAINAVTEGGADA
jgi:hypothetical protein